MFLGHRLRLHFDGYPDNHDFWTNSDSTDIFQPGWCEKNNHRLNPPGFIQEPFNWAAYLKQCKAQPAPKYLFSKSSGVSKMFKYYHRLNSSKFVIKRKCNYRGKL